MRIFASVAAFLCLSILCADAAPPDPAKLPFKLPKDITWSVHDAADNATLFGDPAKPGPYGVLIRWHKNHSSRPHFHSTDRYAYVISGTWWVSSSDKPDPATLYPLPAGSFATNPAGTVHWDGAKDEEALIEIVGTGPMTTTYLDGKP